MAIVHHWLVTQGGGERVLESLASIFPEADIFTLLAARERIPASLRNRRITQSFLALIPGSGRWHRHMLPLYPLAVEHLDLRGYDLVISSDAGPMKGIISPPGAIHICYCHAPMRYIWNQFHEYRNELSPLAAGAFSLSAHYVRAWDFAAAQRVTMFVANSVNVSGRIRQYYARPSVVLYPPVDTSRARFDVDTNDCYLTVGRLVAYKRIDLLIEACNRLHRKLRIVGTGPEERALRALAGPTIEFLGQVSEDALWDEYARCRAFLFAAEEDFGMAPVEAQACGRPVIAFGKGGALESVLADDDEGAEATTGIFFLEQTVGSLCDAMLAFEQKENDFDPQFISQWARRFDSSHFLQGFRELAESAIKSRQRNAAAAGSAMPAPVISMQERGAS